MDGDVVIDGILLRLAGAEEQATGFAAANLALNQQMLAMQGAAGAEITNLRAQLGMLSAQASHKPTFRPPPPFKWSPSSSTTLHTWLFTLSTYFVLASIVDPLIQVALAGSNLEFSALVWWQSLCANPVRMPTNFDDFSNALKATYLPSNYEDQLRIAYKKCHQTTSVTTYTTRFQSLLLQLPAMEPGSVLFDYISGLKPHLQTSLRLFPHHDLQLAINMAQRLDTNQSGSFSSPSTSSPHRPSHAPSSSNRYRNDPMELGHLAHLQDVSEDSPEDYPEDQDVPEDQDIGSINVTELLDDLHALQVESNKWRKNQSMPAYKPTALAHITCFNCGKLGHIAAGCPQPKKKTAVPLNGVRSRAL